MGWERVLQEYREGEKRAGRSWVGSFICMTKQHLQGVEGILWRGVLLDNQG